MVTDITELTMRRTLLALRSGRWRDHELLQPDYTANG
jgi:hypothetical protein